MVSHNKKYPLEQQNFICIQTCVIVIYKPSGKEDYGRKFRNIFKIDETLKLKPAEIFTTIMILVVAKKFIRIFQWILSWPPMASLLRLARNWKRQCNSENTQFYSHHSASDSCLHWRKRFPWFSDMFPIRISWTQCTVHPACLERLFITLVTETNRHYSFIYCFIIALIRSFWLIFSETNHPWFPLCLAAFC